MSEVTDLLERTLRRDDEPEHVAKAFRDYLVLEPPRTYAEVSRMHGVTRITVSRWAKSYDWKEREAKYDRARRQAQDDIINYGLEAGGDCEDEDWTDNVEMSRRTGQIVIKYQQVTEALINSLRSRAGLTDIEDRFMDIGTVSLLGIAERWVALTIRLETSAELAAAIRDHGESQTDALQALSDEEILALQRMQRKVRTA